MSNQKLAYAICDYLSKSLENGTISKDNQEGIEVALQSIQEAFSINHPSDKEKYAIKAGLDSIFSVYLQTQKSMDASAPAAPSKADKEQAEALKSAGNKLLASKQFSEAVEKYTLAIGLDGSNEIYYSNRAAAYSQLGSHDLAAADAKKALEINPEYSKAYSRLGHAEFCLGNYSQAVESYTKGLEKEPNNASMIQSLAAAKQKLEVSSVAKEAPANPFAGGFPGMGGMGGMPDLSKLMSDPNIMNMAQKMMSNPAMAGIMENMRNGGGMPDISSLMSNPEVANMAQSMMQDPETMNTLMQNPNVADLASKYMPKK